MESKKIKKSDIGKKVHYIIISKDSKGQDKFSPEIGIIDSINTLGTGYVIRGISTAGLYNRCAFEVEMFKTDIAKPIEIIDSRKILSEPEFRSVLEEKRYGVTA